MEQQPNENLNLFGLSIDPTSRIHLGEAARWARFLSIVGFIVIGLFVVVALFFSSTVASSMSGGGMYGDGYSSGVGLGSTVIAVTYILISLLWFFPTLFLFRFASKMKAALATNEQDSLNVSFQNLKAMLRFMGILTIIGLVLWVLALLTTIIGLASAGF
ncbi:MAG: hypothetical protein EOO09_05705 [Chitinophagaceae bacterium]|nr:MAG: hypothetical protein EOO09_05705 [Chitinophagaceae bacterium]